jgi:hypothetical protein
MAYFIIGVVVPWIYIYMRGEKGRWTITGSIWSLAAGAAGAIGALGIILAFNYGGRPLFVMPLVFGGAPVVNSFLTMFMSKTYKQVGPIFIAGLILVVVGAVTVMLFKPGAGDTGVTSMSMGQLVQVILSILLVVVFWGMYGPVLHKGQMKMEGSRLRPLICVGLAYFAIAVVVPTMMLQVSPEESSYANVIGTWWSLAAGTAGAVGALGIIMAFNFGGKPIFVMPLVFGGAPVINTFTTMIMSKGGSVPGPVFYAGLLLVATGAVVVLVFAPKGHPPAATPKPEVSKATT